MKRCLAALLAIILLFAAVPVLAEAQEDAVTSFSPTDEETALIEASRERPITVGVIASSAPACYWDEERGEYMGIFLEVLEKISEKTGLQFQYVEMDMSAGTPAQQIKQGYPELVVGVLREKSNLEDAELILSQPITEDALVLVGRRTVNFMENPEQRTIAVPMGFPVADEYISRQFPLHNVAHYLDADECLSAVASGTADATVYMRSCISYLLQNPHYDNLEMVPAYTRTVSPCIVGRAADKAPLLGIIDKGIEQITDSERNDIIMNFTIMNPYHMTPADTLYKYHVIVITVILLLVAVATLLIILGQRTAQKKAALETKKAEKQLSEIIQTVPCGICMYRLENGNLSPILVNHQFKQMLGDNAEEYLSSDKGLDYTHAHPDDIDRLRQEVMHALTETNELDTTFRSWNQKLKKYIWMRMRGNAIPQPDGSRNIYVSYYDVTQERMAEHLAEIALESSGVSIWEYNYEQKCIIQYQNSVEMHGFDTVIPNVPQSLVESGFVHPDSAKEFLAMYDKLFAGEPFAQGVFRVQTADRTGWWYEHIRYTNEFDINGNLVRAAGMSTDETEKQETTMRYRRELELKKSSQTEEKLLAYALFDLTRREMLECRYKGGDDVPDEDRTDFEYAKVNAELLIDSKERAQFIALNDIDTLLALFDSGESEFKLEYRRRIPGGKIIWVRNFMHMLRDPQSGNVCLFQYWYDIDDEKIRELMYKSVATGSYDFVAHIDGVTKRFEVISRTGMNFHMPPQSGEDADEVTRSMYSECVIAEDRDAVIENSLIENVNRHLSQSKRYVFTYRITRPDGELRYKRVTHYYIDPARKIIVMLREDVTDIIKAEAEKNRVLETALTAAERASAAKGEFMSRMSHEIRTPLNAIIGYNTIAKNAIAEARTDEQRRQADTNAMDCLSKSELASKHLLTVINDVLDMSAIESGKIRLAKERFDFKSLIGSLTVLFYSQAKAKGITFDVAFDSPSEEWFIGDQMRINQILTNLLSNAVKFTPEGGSVKMNISPKALDVENMRFCFEISDTGIGMSREYVERLWQPFEQEDSSISRRFGGTGLGLAITKSLVDIMDGDISVDSEQGIGSVFRVELTLERAEQPQEAGLHDFSDIHALIVDDDISSCDYIKLLFDRCGARSQTFNSGMDAIAAFQMSLDKDDRFTLCMVDWQMPGMDGVATVREIRKLAGNDVPIIIVTAYDYTEIAEKVKDEGVTMFVAKPLFQSSLFDLLSTISGAQKPHSVPENDAVSFSGARVLLAEDNQMNMEVAKRILESAGITADGAWNGKEAVSMFEASAPGTYKLILMDVHMPEMDGYQATKTIRNSAHPEGAIIPIIAMTADAFAENVAEAYSIGMNDHIAKPVDIDILFKTLRKYIPS